MGDEVYIPHPGWLKEWAEYFRGWVTKLDSLWWEVHLCKLTPGQIAEAEALVTRFTSRKESLENAITYLMEKFRIIADGLDRLADVYTHTNDLNDEDVERMRLLLDEVGVEDGYIIPSKHDYDIPPPPTDEPDEEPEPKEEKSKG
jgi:hypothetical protein